MSQDVEWCLDPLDPENWWTFLDLVLKEGKEWAEGGPVAVAGGAIGPEVPWPAPDMDPECFLLGMVEPFPKLPVGGAGGVTPWADC